MPQPPPQVPDTRKELADAQVRIRDLEETCQALETLFQVRQ